MNNHFFHLVVVFLVAIWLGNINRVLEICPRDVGATFWAYSMPVEI